MTKKELIAQVARKAAISEGQSETVVNEIIAELASPHVLRAPGSEVALLDNSCRNNCKEQIAERTTSGP